MESIGGEPHIPIARLVDVMLHQAALTEEEGDHLARCPKCMEEMIEGTRKKLGISAEE